MRDFIYIFALLATACTLVKPYHQPLAHDAGCPTICWLGINPGISSIKDTMDILDSSNQVTKVSDNPFGGLSVNWETGDRDYFSSRVEISFENGTVNGITFTPYPLRLGELIDKIGPPEEISLIQELNPHGGVFTTYIVYFLSMNSLLKVDIPIEDGPSENDTIDILIVNINPDDPSGPWWVINQQQYRQPWLGFGHFEEYLRNRPLPSQ